MAIERQDPVRTLVIGGTRFVGPPAVRRLVERDIEVKIYHRGKTEADLPAAVGHVHGDRSQLAQYRSDFASFMPDVVLDMAAYSEQDAAEVMQTLRGLAGRVVALSSQDVYRAYGRFHGKEQGSPEPVPFAEDASLRKKLYPYRGDGRGLDDYEKIHVEQIVMGDPELPGTVLRLPMTYGPGDYQHRLFAELKRMDDGRPAILLSESIAGWRWTRAYVENVAEAIALAVTDERAAGRIYNLGEPEALTYREWVAALGEAAGWQGNIVVVPDDRLPPQLQPPPGDYAQHLVADTTRIREELGYREPVPREEALGAAIAWERAHRPKGKPEWFDYEAEDALLAEYKGAG